MTIKNILCAYSGESAMGSGLRRGIALARHHDAWLTGALQHERAGVERRFGGRLTENLVEELRDADRRLIHDVTKRFEAAIAEHGLSDRSDFVVLDAAEGHSLAQFARSFDLVVTGVHSRLLGDEHMSANPDRIALQSGRPVLIVPDGYEGERLAERALVAWDGQRAAARALADAMPILAEKARVTILCVGDSDPAHLDTLLRNTRRHGVAVEYLRRKRDGSVARTILKASAEVSARLIVMGAFEHSKFAHDVWGGVTTDVMRDSPVPLFMSH